MFKAKSYKENWVLYFWLEIIIKAVLAFSGSFFFLLFILLQSTRADSGILEYLFERPLLYSFICFVPAVISTIVVLLKHGKWRVVGYEFLSNSILLLVRKNRISSLKEVQIGNKNLETYTEIERELLTGGGNRGLVIKAKESSETYWFGYDSFVWEKHTREKIEFARYIKSLTGVSLGKRPKEKSPQDIIPRY